MAKITELANIISVDSNADVIPIVDVSEGTTKKITPKVIQDSIVPVETFTYVPTFKNVNATTLSPIHVVRQGMFMSMSGALWITVNSIISPNDPFYIDLPSGYTAIGARNYGQCGYNQFGVLDKSVFPSIAESTPGEIAFEYQSPTGTGSIAITAKNLYDRAQAAADHTLVVQFSILLPVSKS